MSPQMRRRQRGHTVEPVSRPHRASNPRPVAVVPTPRFALFWVASLALHSQADTRSNAEALIRAAFTSSLQRQGRRAVDTPELSWVPCRRLDVTRHPDTAPMVSDLTPCLPGESPQWWLLTIHARTIPRGPAR